MAFAIVASVKNGDVKGFGPGKLGPWHKNPDLFTRYRTYDKAASHAAKHPTAIVMNYEDAYSMFKSMESSGGMIG